jgi:arylsulfatase A-like enzyme
MAVPVKWVSSEPIFKGGIYDYTQGQFENGAFIPGGEKEMDAWATKDKLGGVGYQKDNYDTWKKFSGWATSQGQGWAAYSNTPFRKFKKFVHEGGIASPFIAHWPKVLKSKNKIISHPYFHFIDIMPTLLDVAGIQYPDHYQDKARAPLEGTQHASLSC